MWNRGVFKRDETKKIKSNDAISLNFSSIENPSSR